MSLVRAQYGGMIEIGGKHREVATFVCGGDHAARFEFRPIDAFGVNIYTIRGLLIRRDDDELAGPAQRTGHDTSGVRLGPKKSFAVQRKFSGTFARKKPIAHLAAIAIYVAYPIPQEVAEDEVVFSHRDTIGAILSRSKDHRLPPGFRYFKHATAVRIGPINAFAPQGDADRFFLIFGQTPLHRILQRHGHYPTIEGGLSPIGPVQRCRIHGNARDTTATHQHHGRKMVLRAGIIRKFEIVGIEIGGLDRIDIGTGRRGATGSPSTRHGTDEDKQRKKVGYLGP